MGLVTAEQMLANRNSIQAQQGLSSRHAPATIEIVSGILKKLSNKIEDEWDVSLLLIENSETVNEKLIALFEELGYCCLPRNGHYFLRIPKKT